MKKIKVVLTLLIVGLLASSVLTQQKKATSGTINVNAVRAHIKFLSDDLLEGRGPGTRGGELAAKYIATQLEGLGLKGAGAQGSFYQPVSLVGVKADPQTTLTVESKVAKEKRETFKFADEYVAFTGTQTEDVALNSELVFVGYGIDAPEQRWNDYKGDAADYRDKILVIMVNDPPATATEPKLFGARSLTYYGRWTYKYEEAARRGAAGVILLHTDESAGYPWSVVRTSNGSWRFDIARGPDDKTPFLKMRAWITDAAARRMMQAAGQDLDALRKQAASRDFKPVKLNLQATINLKSEVKRVEAPNVAAILPGRDAKLRDEYVMYTAHWDHFGIGEPNSKGDRIYNGALDNATGVGCVLGLAEALARMPESERPRRSVLFLLTTAEEQGLLGAEWYAQHPLVPLKNTAANVNLDSMNILGPTRDFVPLGAERSTLKAVVDAVGREMSLQVGIDPRPEQGSFYRSDHFPFAKAGVPAVSLEAGKDFVGHDAAWGEQQFEAYNTANYHQPSDEYSDSWNFEGMMQETEIALAIGLRIANADATPHFNPDDEFARADQSRK